MQIIPHFPFPSRSKNTVNILIKNWLDMCIGAMVYWAVGFAITFGKSRPGIAYFMGTSYYFFHEMPRESHIFTSRQSQLQPRAQLKVYFSPFRVRRLSFEPCIVLETICHRSDGAAACKIRC